MVTIKELDQYMKYLGFDVEPSIPHLSLEYSKINILGDKVRYKIGPIDEVNYLIYESSGLYIRWNSENLAFFNYPDEDVKRLGYWTDLDKMNRFVQDIANPGDDPLMVLDTVIYGFNNDL